MFIHQCTSERKHETTTYRITGHLQQLIHGMWNSTCRDTNETSRVYTEATALTSSTPDPCAPENLEASIKAVNDLMREFDDSSQLASNLSKEQVPDSFAEMQRIRRAAEDQMVPTCLVTLKKYQVAHMNSVINTMLAFVGGADNNTLNTGLAQARKEHDSYTLEIIKLLGITPQSVNTTTP
jgi:hypothetical protein